jgi:hypothetical protein
MPRTHLLPLHLMDYRAQPSPSSYDVSNAALEQAGLAHTNTGSSDSQEAIHIALYRDDNPPAADCGYVTIPRFHWALALRNLPNVVRPSPNSLND